MPWMFVALGHQGLGDFNGFYGSGHVMDPQDVGAVEQSKGVGHA